eukprot:1153159-Pelagomonas_calceolata.AAC.1
MDSFHVFNQACSGEQKHGLELCLAVVSFVTDAWTGFCSSRAWNTPSSCYHALHALTPQK